MKIWNIVVLLLTLSLLTGPVAEASEVKSKPLPPKFSYTIFVEGQNIGKSETKFTQTSDRLIFDTNTYAVFGEYKLDLTSHTEADKNTYAVLEFTYEGQKSTMMLGGEVYVEGDSIHGCTIENGSRYPATRTTTFDQILMLEDYVVIHQVLIARAYFTSDRGIWNTEVFLPSTFRTNKIAVGKTADAYLESDIAEATVSKIQVQMSGAHQYIIFYDNKRGMPLYVAFPGVNTEVFLEEFYGDNPISRYRLPTVKNR